MKRRTDCQPTPSGDILLTRYGIVYSPGEAETLVQNLQAALLSLAAADDAGPERAQEADPAEQGLKLAVKWGRRCISCDLRPSQVELIGHRMAESHDLFTSPEIQPYEPEPASMFDQLETTS